MDGKFDWRPQSSQAFFLARLSETGQLQKYLECNCDKMKLELCDYIDSIPKNTQAFLFDRKSPFVKTDGWKNNKENSEIIRGIYLSPEYFWTNIKEAVKISYQQLKVFSIGHLIWKYKPDIIWGSSILKRFYPNEYDNFLNDRQMIQDINFHLFTKINNYIISIAFYLTLLILTISIIFIKEIGRL